VTTSPAPQPDESIDLGQLMAALRRGWLIVLASGAGGLLTAAVLTARTPQVWQADFQIVLADDKGGSGLSSLLSQVGGLAALVGAGGGAGGGGGDSSQETELKVLLSPSVLLPVFEFVKRQQPSGSAGLSFRSWASAVAAKAEKGTAVLNVTYQGTDPALVLAASRKLASTYQGYAGRKRQRSLQGLVSYLQEQILTYRPRAAAARDRAEAFAQRYALTSADAQLSSGSTGLGLGVGSSSDLSSLFAGIANNLQGGSAGGSIRAQRSELTKRIRDLEFQRQRVLAAGDTDALNYASSGIGTLGTVMGNLGSSTGSLQELDRVIAERRSRLQDNDPTLVSLRRQRRVLVGALNRQLAKELENAIALSRAQLASLERPPGVLEQFQKLSRAANQDETVLQNLETALEQQKLELARDSSPWDLISEPTLSDKPVSPNPARNLLLGLLAGLVSGAGAALLRERRTGLVFHLDELLELLPYPLLGQLNSSHSERWSGVLELLAHGPLQGCPQVALIPVGPIDSLAQHLADALQQTLQRQDPAAQVLRSHDLLLAGRCQAQLLVASLGVGQREAMAQLQQDLQLQNRPVSGLLLLSAPQAGDDA
jgi:succinoglycan biosynthesis transport protein ExoP